MIYEPYIVNACKLKRGRDTCLTMSRQLWSCIWYLFLLSMGVSGLHRVRVGLLYHSCTAFLLPRDTSFDAHSIEVLRLLGKLHIEVDNQAINKAKSELGRPESRKEGNKVGNVDRATSVRLFEARVPNGKRHILREYLNVALSYGRREVSVLRKLTLFWNRIETTRKQYTELITRLDFLRQDRKYSQRQLFETLTDDEINAYQWVKSWQDYSKAPFVVLVGATTVDNRVTSPNYIHRWRQRMPRVPAPNPGAIWLLLRWDDAAFRSLRRFPSLPQVVPTLEYFDIAKQDQRRWRFVRKLVRRSLEAIGFLHRLGYCHNSISSESLWMTTTNQLEIDDLHVKLTDFGASQSAQELGDDVLQEGMVEDLYQLGFVFLEVIVASFCEDNVGAQVARSRLAGEQSYRSQLLYRVEDVNQKQLTQREFRQLFERHCYGDFQTFREFFRAISPWATAVRHLEASQGAAWRLIFTMLTRGRLVSDDDERQSLLVTADKLILRYRSALFSDTYENAAAPPRARTIEEEDDDEGSDENGD